MSHWTSLIACPGSFFLEDKTEKRSLKQIIFGKTKKPPKNLKQFKVLNGFVPIFSNYTGNVTTSDVYQTAVQAHARHFSKLIPQAVIKGSDSKIKLGSAQLNRVLGLRPNELMSTATFLEKCAFQYFNFNNVYIYIKRNSRGEVDSLWVLDAATIEPCEDEQGQIYFRFSFMTDTIIVPYFDLIHIPRNVSASDFMGGNNDTIKQVIRIIETNYEGIEKSIKLSAFIRFIVEYSSPLNEETKAKKAEQFRDLFLNRGDGEEELGVAIAGGTEKITQVQSQAKFADHETTKLLDTKVYDYLAINQKIISGNYSEDEWQAYYDSAVEPFVVKLTQELTYKLFTVSEYESGNYIVINVDKLQNANFGTRIKILKQTQETGDMTVNERRELLYLKAVDDGDVRLVSKNYGKSSEKTEVKKND